MFQPHDVVVIGAGAAGLMCAIFAARSRPNRRVFLLDGARTLGAKILVAGGGRCNVTHDIVDHTAYFGSSPHAIKNVLRRFSVPETVSFFRDIGVELKREETGKLFPVTDDARTVLNALLVYARHLGVEIEHPRRVTSVIRLEHSSQVQPVALASLPFPRFRVGGDWGSIDCTSLVLATGGKSLPRSGSDGAGYEFASSLGHSISPRLMPALVPLLLPAGHILCSLSGIATDATLQVRSGTGRKIISFTGAVLCTHFGLSGPCVLDISRHYLDAVATNPPCRLVANWIPSESFDSLDALLVASGTACTGTWLRERLSSRFADAVCSSVGIDPAGRISSIPRESRRGLVRNLVEMDIPIVGSRGFNYAEVTAGGVPLDEIYLDTMQSRRCPGLYFCGEICDVDGRIGGYNFQWAWSSGYTAGVSI